jgi:hypothetical protein
VAAFVTQIEETMSALIQALSSLHGVLPDAGSDDHDKWVVVVCIAGFCVLTLTDLFVR